MIINREDMKNITADQLGFLAHRYIEAFRESEAYYEDLDTNAHKYYQEAREDYYEALELYVSEY